MIQIDKKQLLIDLTCLEQHGFYGLTRKKAVLCFSKAPFHVCLKQKTWLTEVINVTCCILF